MSNNRYCRCGWAITLVLALAPIANAQLEKSYPQPPQALFKELFAAVQLSSIFADGKAFADAVPNTAPRDILLQYRREQPQTPQALKRFVAAHFTLPAQVALPAPLGQVPMLTHVDSLWDVLTRSSTSSPRYASLLTLPQPYVVPGGRFREIYYWDSYFTMLGLQESGRNDLVADMAHDFAFLIDTYGHVPNGTRTYYLSRSQPPFFFAMVGLLYPDELPKAYAQYLAELKIEYSFWMKGARGLHVGRASRRVVSLGDGVILNRYWDDRDTPRDESYREDSELARSSGREPRQLFRDIRAAAESGWDFSSRWFGDGRTRSTINTTEIVPIDLNSLLFGLENAIQVGCKRLADHVCEKEFAARAAARQKAIDRYLWDESGGVYRDFHWTQHAKSAQLSAATLYPLFVGLASPRQAAAVAKAVERDLLQPGGLATSMLVTGQQWDAPNGWAPLQWIATAGLRRYGNASLAESIACRWIINVHDAYSQSGKLVEKYDVTNPGRAGGGGEYPTQDGFGWTNGVLRKLVALYPADLAYSKNDQCP